MKSTNRVTKSTQSKPLIKIDESGFNSFSGNDEPIRKKAYELAQKRGFEPGHELDDWLAAEQTVNSTG